MSLDLLFPNFETLIRTPEDVARLNEAILGLAVQGKLVPQDPADEPASELLRRIQEQRRRFAETGKAVDPKPLPPISAKQIPYEITKNWKWVRLAEIAGIIMGQSPPGNSYNADGEGVPLINGPVEFSEGPFGETQKTKFTTTPTKTCQTGDLLLCVRASIGRTNVAAFDACIGRGVAAIRAYVSQEYLNHFILSQRRAIYDLGTGSTFPSVSQDRIRELLVPLPPLAEQRRIVAKVESLFAQTRALEAKLRQAQADIVTVNRAALNRLSVAADDDAFAAAWATVRDAFDLLYDDPRNVADLRQAILQLAVQGKLVPQDPADEPASELLKRIRAEKRRLVKDGELREEKPMPPVKPDEFLFDSPANWTWTRIGDVCLVKGGKRVPKGYMLSELPTEHIYIRVTDMKDGSIDDSDLKYISDEVYQVIGRYTISSSDLYITIAGTIGKVGLIPDRFDGMNLTENAAKLTFALVNQLFARYLLGSPFIQRQFQDKVNQMAQPKLALERIETTIIPLPPLAEQHRIVAKVDQLMRLCDALEAGLARADGQRRALTAAALHGAFNPAR